MKSMKHLTILAAAVLLMAGLAACTAVPIQVQLPPPPNGANGDIAIGLVVPLSGPIAGAGTSMKNSAELAQQEINAAQLGSARMRFVVEDSAGPPAEAVAIFEQMIEAGEVVAILGPVVSGSAAEAFPVAQENGMVAFSPVAAAAELSEIGDFVFQGNLTVDVVIPGGVALTQEALGYERVAIIVDEADLFSQSGLESLQAAFADQGVEIVATEFFQTGDTDLATQLGRIAESSPDAVFISSLPAEATQVLIEAGELGMTPETQFIIPLAFSTAEATQAGDAAEGVITFSTWDSAADTPGNRDFVQRYRATYDSEPDRFGAQWYAATKVLATAIHQAGSTEPAAIQDALMNLGEVETVLGTFSFNESGAAVYDPVILIVQDGMLVPFE